ncbi:calcium/sodium antiporter [Oleidesulfovibrio sp.]|uniref:calcium/sodium antiporter n=1 Tax=Oleidesulfovibrio sp. TaxID=2909707 RepID=UPI003A85DF2D
MTLPIVSIIAGLLLLVYSADRFVLGSSATARHFGMPPLLIGMVVVGFGTSVPEMLVSLMAALDGTPGIALGNAYGSNITNIGLILGATAVLGPIMVSSQVLRKELPILIGVTLMTGVILWDGSLTRTDAAMLLVVFAVLVGWSIYQGMRSSKDAFGEEMEQQVEEQGLSFKAGLFWTLLGLALLIVSSRMLVWGAVQVAVSLGLSELVIGLTIVAIGTSLPELASSLAAARRGEHDIALGNVVGSNLFNTLAVVGIAGVVSPMQVDPAALSRDLLVMGGFTVALFVMGYPVHRAGRINRLEGSALLVAYLAYSAWLALSASLPA